LTAIQLDSITLHAANNNNNNNNVGSRTGTVFDSVEDNKHRRVDFIIVQLVALLDVEQLKRAQVFFPCWCCHTGNQFL
jgi:hypothetical protein